MTNLRWLSGFRSVHADQVIQDAALAAVSSGPRALGELARTGPPWRVRPQLFSMLWFGQLRADPDASWTDDTLIGADDGTEDGWWVKCQQRTA